MTIELLANIDVDDLEQAIEFYRAALGLRLGRRFSGSVAEMLEASSAIYLLAKPAGSRASVNSPRRVGGQRVTVAGTFLSAAGVYSGPQKLDHRLR